MDEKQYLEARAADLMEKTFQRDIVTATGFLTEAEQAVIADYVHHQKNRCPCLFWGGYEDALRRMAVFLPSYMNEELFLEGEQGADGSLLLAALLVRPLQKKFAEPLTHRDYLGALMHLGIEREMVGDILVNEEKGRAVIFVLRKMSETICRELVRVRHTTVYAEEMKGAVDVGSQNFEEMTCSVASDRLDAVLAGAYRLSRSKAQDLIRSELVSVNGRIVQSPDMSLKEGDRISVRGFGKMIYDGVGGKSRKERLFVRIRHYK